MNGRMVARGFVLSIVLTLGACANTPRSETSILDAVNSNAQRAPQSCDAMGAAIVCRSRSRFDVDCQCIDRRSLVEGN